MLTTQKGFTAVHTLISIILVIVIIGAGYSVYKVRNSDAAHSGIIDVKELGFKLSFSDVNHWSYQVSPDLSNSVNFSYKGWGRVGYITRYSSINIYSDQSRFKRIGTFYLRLSKFGCPCTKQGDQYFAQLNNAFNTAEAD